MAKKQQAHNNINWKNVLRWGLLIPVLGVVWWLVAMGGAFVAGYFFVPIDLLFIVLDMLVIPGVAMFFVARWIAPGYKNIAGWVSVLLGLVWFVWLTYGLVHLAY